MIMNYNTGVDNNSWTVSMNNKKINKISYGDYKIDIKESYYELCYTGNSIHVNGDFLKQENCDHIHPNVFDSCN